MAKLPGNYVAFTITLAVPQDMIVSTFSLILEKAAEDIRRNFSSLVTSPHVMTLRDDNGVLVGAITRTEGGN